MAGRLIGANGLYVSQAKKVSQEMPNRAPRCHLALLRATERSDPHTTMHHDVTKCEKVKREEPSRQPGTLPAITRRRCEKPRRPRGAGEAGRRQRAADESSVRVPGSVPPARVRGSAARWPSTQWRRSRPPGRRPDAASPPRRGQSARAAGCASGPAARGREARPAPPPASRPCPPDARTHALAGGRAGSGGPGSAPRAFSPSPSAWQKPCPSPNARPEQQSRLG